MPIRDEQLMLRQTSDGALSSSAALTNFEFDGTPIKGLALQVNLPTTPTGSSPSLAVYIHASSSTTCSSANAIVGQKTAITASGEYIIPFSAPWARAITVKLDVAGSSPSLGAVQVAIVKNVGDKWDRSISFR